MTTTPATVGRPWKRVAGLVPGVVVLLGAAVLLAHDATWSTWVSIPLAIIGLFAVALPITYGRGRGFVVLVAGVAVLFGGVGVVDGGWLVTVGRTDDATVTAKTYACVDSGRTCRTVDRLTLRSSDGEVVPGHLDLDSPSGVGVGDTVDVRWDPTGLLANSKTLGESSPVRGIQGAVILLGAVVALGVLAFTSKPEPYVPRSQRVDHSPEGIRRRLEAETQARTDAVAATAQQHATFADRRQAGLG